MKSIWFDHSPRIETDAFEPNAHYDVVVVGAGLTGLTTALLLSRAGLNVTVLEARSVGAATTGHTTAKLSLLQGTVLSSIRRHFSEEIVQAYVAGNLEGQAWMLRYLKEQNVAAQRRAAYTYTVSESGRESLEQEAEAGRAAGLDITFSDGDIGLPYPIHAALHLADQAQFHPLEVLAALANDVRARGGRIVEGIRVRNISAGTPATVLTDSGSNRAEQVILATGTPILDRGLYFAKVRPSRSYVAAYANADPAGHPAGMLPRGMFLSVDQPARSLRTVTLDGEEILLVGGNGHPVGESASEQAHVSDLDDWTHQWFPGYEATHHWSAQDYQSANMVPFVGKLPRGGGNIQVATGYNKWGMTNAVAAALRLSAEILGGDMPWAQTLSHRITGPHDLLEGAKFNAGVAAKLAGGWLGAIFAPEATQPRPASAGAHISERDVPEGGISEGDAERTTELPPSAAESEQPVPAEGQGWIAREGLRPTALSTVEGKTCQVSAVCTHLGGVLTWNDAEKSWDCPLHGSRFSPEGEVLEGPATHDLPSLSDAPIPGPPTATDS